MKTDWRWLLLIACNLLLLALTAMVNDGLTPLLAVLSGGHIWWNVSLLLAGPCVVWPALRLPPLGMLACVALTGLATDAQLPTPAGFLTTLFVLGATGVVIVQPWLGRAGLLSQLGLAWLLNSFYFLAFTIWAAQRGTTGLAFWERAAIDFCLSQLILLPVAAWFFAFQASILRFAGLPVAQEPLIGQR